ncbi:MAG: hypothetical protein R2853_17020 [Thermomicrobiales bacterium]
MSEVLDQLSRSLASGASRRRALGALLASSVSTIPLTAEGRKNRKKRKRKLRRRFAPYQQACGDWCQTNAQLPGSTVSLESCLKAAKEGKGPCFGPDGSGAACLDQCPKGQFCCPTLLNTGKVGFIECCTTQCGLSLNNTLICNI